MFSLRKIAALALTCAAIFTMLPDKALAAGKNGWEQIGTDWYYYTNGKKTTGWIKDGGKWYYLDKSSGYMHSDRFLDKIDGHFYSFDKSGAMVSNKLIKYSIGPAEDGKEYYLYAYFKADGAAYEGWKKISGKWYYFSSSGYTYPYGPYVVNGKQYINTRSGYMAQNQWGYIPFKEAGNYQYFYAGSDGVLVTGWKKISGKWYYLAPVMLRGLRTIDGKQYFFNDSGAMETGWVFYYDEWYYFDKSGAGRDGWVGNKEYYCIAGKMLRSRTYTVGGVKYSFDKDGHPSIAK